METAEKGDIPDAFNAVRLKTGAEIMDMGAGEVIGEDIRDF